MYLISARGGVSHVTIQGYIIKTFVNLQQPSPAKK